MSTLAVNTITNAAGGNTAQINGMTPTADSLQGFRNRLINSDMRIDQRNAGASITFNDGVYPVDRWRSFTSQSSKATAQQNAGSETPPAGFANYLGITSSSAYSVVSSDVFAIGQMIEGFNSADLAWGTASASTVTLSFWVRSSLTGTFGGALQNSARSLTYPFTYSISSANTWEQKFVTIAGPTSSTWLTTNGIGVQVILGIGAGATYSGTAGSWASANYFSATGAVSVVGTSGATFYITGVQLEAGSVATPFERRPYGTELALCQRYYYKNNPAIGTPFGSCAVQTTSEAEVYVYFPVTMRAAPTALEQSGTANQYAIYTGGGVNASNAVPTFNWATQFVGVPQFNFAAVLTAGRAGTAYAATTSGGFLAWSAEL